jgi:tetratricopeptide (TPR) repeat protein
MRRALSRGALLTALAASAALTVAPPGRAQTQTLTPAERQRAKKLFEEAARLEEAQDWAAAVLKLDEALAIKETPGLRYHRAYCLEQQGKLVEALEEYDRSEALLELAPANDVKELLGPARDALMKRTPVVEVVIPADARNPIIQVDGVERELSAALRLNPGTRHLRVTARGQRDFVKTLELEERDRELVRVEFPKAAEAAPLVAQPAPQKPDTVQHKGLSTRTVILISGTAVTLAGGGAGVVFTLQRRNAHDRAERSWTQCYRSEDPGDACEQLQSRVDDYDRTKVLQAVSFGVAGAGAAATVLTALLWPRSRPAPEPENIRTLRISFAPSSDGSSVVVSGRF